MFLCKEIRKLIQIVNLLHLVTEVVGKEAGGEKVEWQEENTHSMLVPLPRAGKELGLVTSYFVIK